MDQQPVASSPKQQIIDHLATANNVLVTVSNNPSVDQLAACIGLTLLLNKMGKHGTAVFSGQIPSTIEFLKPEETLEQTTDSLRDFIIALDKAKADKLRYKVEDKLVKIFITPYRTSITDKDLEFSQGDFNVDMVMALGVQKKDELDQAITAHGRILHDATVVAVNTKGTTDIGAVNWQDEKSSSLCEMVTSLAETMKSELVDAQIATALMTGIVAETKRFSNNLTTSVTMSLSARLMSAGANQQLVASELKESGDAHAGPVSEPAKSKPVKSAPEPKPEKPEKPEEPAKPDAEVEIDHHDDPIKPVEDLPKLDEVVEPVTHPPVDTKHDDIHIDEHGVLQPKVDLPEPPKLDELPSLTPTPVPETKPEPPDASDTFKPMPTGFDLTAPIPEPAISPLPTLTDGPATSLPPVFGQPLPPLNAENETLTQLEQTVDSPHLDNPSAPSLEPAPNSSGPNMLDQARQAVDQLATATPPSFDALAPPVGDQVPLTPTEQIGDMPLPDSLIPKTPPIDATASPLDNPTAPPPVPPPILPFGDNQNM